MPRQRRVIRLNEPDAPLISQRSREKGKTSFLRLNSETELRTLAVVLAKEARRPDWLLPQVLHRLRDKRL